MFKTRMAVPLDGNRRGAPEYIIPNALESGAVRVDRVTGVTPEFSATMPVYYLSSLDSYVLEAVRVCHFVAIKHFDTGKECAIAELDPPIPGQVLGLASDVTEVVLAARHEGDVLSKICEFPCFVHVARPLIAGIRNQDVVVSADLQNLAWGELYRSK